ncbi:16S rRNA (uracil(1498)-N(3))-methyltransferase [Flammeovirga pacifica]|uniref:Ribosomal RNA small subunit methyltransferase E n=1 Tax=Flammeovirga pacifica TaxID=915059 RepID=A0A1S1YXE5_FLAPC|nr:16S rRNA (uracil(1498)-N(3))-methyltransferase [Flammeovirga pacifica]OHX65525.1 16S rRNA (uracil(1498)-N(3))-methyltransferase [Flammeovirga pacifica]
MRLFYHSEIRESDVEVVLNSEDSKHIVRVLRMKNSDQLYLMDGKGFRYMASIIDANPKKCKVRIDNQEEMPKAGKGLHIGIAPTKNMDRTEFFIEKAIEIGVESISFFFSENSERKNIKLERIERIAISAMKQSRKFHLPSLHLLKNFNDVLSTTMDQKFIAYVPTQTTEYLFSKIKKEGDIMVLVGPEGGFSEKEANRAKEAGFDWVSLGKERLRTETAGIVAVQLMNMKTFI